MSFRPVPPFLVLLAATTAGGQTFTVTSNADTNTFGTLRWAIGQANNFDGAYTIILDPGLAPITLTSELPVVTNRFGLTINGNGRVIDGANAYRPFFLGISADMAAGLPVTTSAAWNINNLTLQNVAAIGGNGGGGTRFGGGGGAGLGGGVFVNAGALTLTNVNFLNAVARGGDGGAAGTSSFGNGYSGGGGLGGVGGSGSTGGGGGGGGGWGSGAFGGNAPGGGGGPGLHPFVGGGGGTAGTTSNFGTGGDGGGVGGGTAAGGSGGNGGFGGGGGGNAQSSGGGNGGFGGGGGGGYFSAGGTGQFSTGGNGGFGGGAGAGQGLGGFGGGQGSMAGVSALGAGFFTSAGSGGLGAGGAVFVRQGASVNLVNTTFSGGSVAGGNGYFFGQGIGVGVFLAGSTTYTVNGSQTDTISTADFFGGGTDSQISGGLVKAGTGTLVLAANQSYTGGTAVQGGVLSFSDDNQQPGLNYAQLGRRGQGVALQGGTLRYTGASMWSSDRPLSVSGVGTLDVGSGGAQFDTDAPLSGSGTFTKTGSGLLILNADNPFAGEVIVSQGGLRLNGAMTGGATLTVNGGANLVVNGPLSSAVDVNVSGTAAFGVASTVRNLNLKTGGSVSAGVITPVTIAGSLTSDGGANGLSGSFLLQGVRAFDVATGGTLDSQAYIGDAAGQAGGLNKTGDGTLELRGTGAYTGGTTVTAGVLKVTGFGGLPGNTAFAVNGGTLDLNGFDLTMSSLSGGPSVGGTIALGTAKLTVNQASATSFSGSITGTGSLVKDGAGVLQLRRANTYTGGTTVNAGTLRVRGANAGIAVLAANSQVTVDGGVLEVGGRDSLPTGANALDITVNAAGVFKTLSGFNTGSRAEVRNLALNGGAVSLDYSSGAVDNQQGFILRGGVTATGTSAISPTAAAVGIADGIGLAAGNRIFNVVGASDVLTVSAKLGDEAAAPGGALVKTGAGTLVLSGANTYTGGVATNDFGTLAINADAALGAAAGGVTFTNGVLRTDAAMTLNRALTITTGAVAFINTNGNDVTVSGAVSGLGGFIKQGAGVLTLTNTANGQANNRIDAGTLSVSDDRHLGAAGGTLFMAGGTLQTTADIATSRPMVLAFGSSSTVDAAAGTTLTWNGDVSENFGTGAALTKTGAGTLVLAGANTYTGGTQVQAGTLRVDGSILGGVSVSGGASLGGSGTIAGGLTVTDGRVSPGDSPGVLTVNGLTLGSAAFVDIELGSSAIDRVVINGNAVWDGTLNVTLYGGFVPAAPQSFDILDWTGTASGAFASVALPTLGAGLAWDASALYSAGVLSVVAVSPVPEPSAYLPVLAAAAAAGMAGLRLSRRSRSLS